MTPTPQSAGVYFYTAGSSHYDHFHNYWYNLWAQSLSTIIEYNYWVQLLSTIIEYNY